MTDQTLQAYYDAHDAMITDGARFQDAQNPRYSMLWAVSYGLYKVARYNAVRAGLIPETPQFDEVAG